MHHPGPLIQKSSFIEGYIRICKKLLTNKININIRWGVRKQCFTESCLSRFKKRLKTREDDVGDMVPIYSELIKAKFKTFVTAWSTKHILITTISCIHSCGFIVLILGTSRVNEESNNVRHCNILTLFFCNWAPAVALQTCMLRLSCQKSHKSLRLLLKF